MNIFSRKKPEDKKDMVIRVPNDISKSIMEAQLIISYITCDEAIQVDHETLDVLVKAKYKLNTNTLTAKDEVEFWMAFDQICKIIQPVTVQSLKCSLPSFVHSDLNCNKEKQTRAHQSVLKYRLLTFATLIFLLLIQFYWIIGTGLNSKLIEDFQIREDLKVEILRLKSDETLETRMEYENKVANAHQEMQASYIELLKWNRIWQRLFHMEPFPESVIDYLEKEYGSMESDVRTEIQQFEENFSLKLQKGDGTVIRKLAALYAKEKATIDQHAIEKARNRLFKNSLAANFVLVALNTFILPLLYGLMGAFVFVLRTLSVDVKSLTYSYNSELKFNIRLSLGALGGMTAGWFLGADTLSVISSITSMALSFLVGYNVDMLFSVMDNLSNKIITQISETDEEAEKKDKEGKQ